MMGAVGLIGSFRALVSKLSAKIDQRRICNMNRKSTKKVKRRRKQLRSIKKGFHDDNVEKEEHEYENGAF